jgi:modulator of FtsH protease HflC
MNRFSGVALVIVALLAVFILAESTFTVDPSERVLVLRLGKPVRRLDDPGLHVKLPFFEDIERISKRVLSVEGSQQELLTHDQKRVVVDYFARYHIDDPLLFYQSVRSEDVLEQRLQPVIASQLRRVLGNVEMSRILTKERAELMQQITTAVDSEAKGFGIAVLDVRMKRVDLPQENSQAIFLRMQTQRQQEAARIRAEGDREKQTVQAEADKQRVVIVAEAQKQSEILRGEGDGKATAIYNDAYGRDPAFFDFYRSMQALTFGLAGDTTTYVGPATGDFFRYFGLQPGKAPTGGSAAPAQ